MAAIGLQVLDKVLSNPDATVQVLGNKNSGAAGVIDTTLGDSNSGLTGALRNGVAPVISALIDPIASAASSHNQPNGPQNGSGGPVTINLTNTGGTAIATNQVAEKKPGETSASAEPGIIKDPANSTPQQTFSKGQTDQMDLDFSDGEGFSGRYEWVFDPSKLWNGQVSSALMTVVLILVIFVSFSLMVATGVSASELVKDPAKFGSYITSSATSGVTSIAFAAGVLLIVARVFGLY